MAKKELTPMLKQYFDIKRNYQDAILFFRMGDFYEMFFEDAKLAAPLLEVVLTTRDKKNSVPMCGIPHHALDLYADRVLRKGYKIAVCEQVEDPALAKGIVKREVVKILTPATALEIEGSNANRTSNYIFALFLGENYVAAAQGELAIGSFEIKSYPKNSIDSLISEIYRKAPLEIIISKEHKQELESHFESLVGLEFLFTYTNKGNYYFMESREILCRQFHLENLEGLGLEKNVEAVNAGAMLIKYLQEVRKSSLNNISEMRYQSEENYMVLDPVSFRNLEILKNLRTNSVKGSLIDTIDLTITPMGKRLLREWFSYPLINKEDIKKRQDAVEELSCNLITRGELRNILKEVSDLSKLNSRVSLGIALPKHLLMLALTLKKINPLKKILKNYDKSHLKEIEKKLDPLDKLSDLINKAIDEDPASNLSGGNYIADGYKEDLDQLRGISRNVKEIIAGIEAKERKKSGISNLKVKYNKVFGYFIEITKSNLKLVPQEYIRKQTLVNAERFITSELKALEEKILKAEEKIISLEKEYYDELIKEIQCYSEQLNINALSIALVDVYAAAAELAVKNKYCRPTINDSREIDIKEGRHPVLEQLSNVDFIPNDTKINSSTEQILLITGPNMGGKSTYLRQNALIVIMAQTGFFVPAKKATIGICDRIFTRIGASDSLIEGKSTFLLEMIETAIILNNATRKSLILLDEIGRGTSTFDGLSIAWSVVEYLQSIKEKPKTFFATHYHELTELSKNLKGVVNYHITVREWQDNVVFLHKILKGATDQSFGIHVAKIAGIPLSVINRAKVLLKELELKSQQEMIISSNSPKKESKNEKDNIDNSKWKELSKKIQSLDINNMTPMEAMNTLFYIKKETEKKN